MAEPLPKDETVDALKQACELACNICDSIDRLTTHATLATQGDEFSFRYFPGLLRDLFGGSGSSGWYGKLKQSLADVGDELCDATDSERFEIPKRDSNEKPLDDSHGKMTLTARSAHDALLELMCELRQRAATGVFGIRLDLSDHPDAENVLGDKFWDRLESRQGRVAEHLAMFGFLHYESLEKKLRVERGLAIRANKRMLAEANALAVQVIARSEKQNVAVGESTTISATEQAAPDLTIFMDLFSAATLDANASKIVQIMSDKQKSANSKMAEICEIDVRYYAKSSVFWAPLLSVTDAAIRKTEFWKVERKQALNPD